MASWNRPVRLSIVLNVRMMLRRIRSSSARREPVVLLPGLATGVSQADRGESGLGQHMSPDMAARSGPRIWCGLVRGCHIEGKTNQRL